MNKITFASVTAAALALPVVSLAAPSLPAGTTPSGTGVEPVISILDKVGDWMFGLLLAVAAIYILWAAFTFLIARGDPKKIEEAKTALTYSIVAIVVGALTKGLIVVAQAIARGV